MEVVLPPLIKAAVLALALANREEGIHNRKERYKKEIISASGNTSPKFLASLNKKSETELRIQADRTKEAASLAGPQETVKESRLSSEHQIILKSMRDMMEGTTDEESIEFIQSLITEMLNGDGDIVIQKLAAESDNPSAFQALQ